MYLEAQPWTADFRTSAAPVAFRFSGFRGLGLSCILVLAFSESFGLGFGVFLRALSCRPPRSVPGLVWGVWPFYRGPGHVSEFWTGFWDVPACFVLPTPPAQYRTMVWVIGPLY